MNIVENIWPFIKRHKAIILSLILNICVLGLVTYYRNFSFATNDDRDISNLLADVYGTGKGIYIPFMNIFLCKIVSSLFMILGTKCNWYALLLISLGFLALVDICYQLLERVTNIYVGIVLVLFLLLAIYADYYVTFQFTHYAVILCIAGFLGMTDAFYDEKRRNLWKMALSILLVAIGSMIRFQALFFTMPYVCIVIVQEFILHNRKTAWKDKIRHYRWQLLSFLGMLVLVLGIRGSHLYVYATDEVLKEFNEMNQLRVELLDYGLPDYQENKDEIEELGITEADMECLESQIFLDQEVFSKKVFQKLADMKKENSSVLRFANFNIQGFTAFLKYVAGDFFEHSHWGLLFSILIVYMLCAKKKNVFSLCMGTLFGGMCMWYFLSIERMPYRVWCSIITPVLVFGLYFLVRDYQGIAKRKDALVPKPLRYYGMIYLCIMLFLQAGKVVKDFHNNGSAVVTDDYEKIISFAEENQDVLVLLDRPTVSVLTYNSTIGVLDVPERKSYRNICYQGGWICRTPANLSVLELNEINNPYGILQEGMEVYLVDARNYEKVFRFIQRHYSESIKMELMTYVGQQNIPVWRLYIP